MAVSTTLYTQDQIEAIRQELETVGYSLKTIIANGFDDAPPVLSLIDEAVDLNVTFPVPPDTFVMASLKLCVYSDEATDTGYGITLVTGGFRDGSNDVVLVEEVNTANNFIPVHAELNSDTAAAAGVLVPTIAVNTTYQGIDVSFAGAASSACYLNGRMELVAARKGGFWKKYRVSR